MSTLFSLATACLWRNLRVCSFHSKDLQLFTMLCPLCQENVIITGETMSLFHGIKASEAAVVTPKRMYKNNLEKLPEYTFRDECVKSIQVLRKPKLQVMSLKCLYIGIY